VAVLVAENEREAVRVPVHDADSVLVDEGDGSEVRLKLVDGV
jgi:hypothetical protein